jgi:methionyl aminopeptidase
VRNQKKDIFYKTDEEIELIRQNCLLVCKTLTLVAEMIRPGISGIKIDEQAEQLIRDHGAVPGFKGLYGFPTTLCVSVNDQVVHGVPSELEFKDGDIVSVDCGVFHNDFYGDAAYTFALGDVAEETMKLLRITRASLYKGIEQAVAGKRIGDIGYAIQNYTERQHRYGVVRELVGHGVGHVLHEGPEVPNYGKRGKGVMMKEGLVIAIEPMINLGRREVKSLVDGTVIARDRRPSAHYEHTVAVRKHKADILSDHKPVEAAILKNPNLKEVEDILAIAM